MKLLWPLGVIFDKFQVDLDNLILVWPHADIWPSTPVVHSDHIPLIKWYLISGLLSAEITLCLQSFAKQWIVIQIKSLFVGTIWAISFILWLLCLLVLIGWGISVFDWSSTCDVIIKLMFPYSSECFLCVMMNTQALALLLSVMISYESMIWCFFFFLFLYLWAWLSITENHSTCDMINVTYLSNSSKGSLSVCLFVSVSLSLHTHTHTRQSWKSINSLHSVAFQVYNISCYYMI